MNILINLPLFEHKIRESSWDYLTQFLVFRKKKKSMIDEREREREDVIIISLLLVNSSIHIIRLEMVIISRVLRVSFHPGNINKYINK